MDSKKQKHYYHGSNLFFLPINALKLKTGELGILIWKLELGRLPLIWKQKKIKKFIHKKNKNNDHNIYLIDAKFSIDFSSLLFIYLLFAMAKDMQTRRMEGRKGDLFLYLKERSVNE